MRFMTFAQVKRAMNAYVRVVEFTRNEVTGLWHPHIRALFLVKRSEYFRGSKLYINHASLGKLWRKGPVRNLHAGRRHSQAQGRVGPKGLGGLCGLQEMLKQVLLSPTVLIR
jgi:Replication protein